MGYWLPSMQKVSAVHRPVRGSTRAVVAGLLTVAALGLLVRCVAVAEPLGIDQSLWASAVRGMARGQLLYRDVWEQRPPGIYFIYLAGFSLFGWTPAAVAVLDILAATATTMLLWGIVGRLSGALAGAAAAALYALFTVPSWLFSHRGFLERSVSETFIVVCVAAAAWCAVRFHQTPRALFAFGIGAASGAAVVLKPNAGLYFPALALWMAVYVPRPVRRDAAVSWITAGIAGAITLPSLTFLYLWSNGLLREAGIAIVDFNRFYVGQGFVLSTYAVDFSRAIVLRVKTDPIWLAGGIGSVLAVWDLIRERRLSPAAGLAVIWGGAAALVIVVNGARLFNSYFLQAYPPLTILAAWLLIESGRRTAGRRMIAAVAGVLMTIVLVQRDYAGRVSHATQADLAALTGATERATYLEDFGGYNDKRGYSARANTELADHVRASTSPDERIFLFGINGAGVYFEADRLTAHRFLRVNFFVPSEFPDPRFTLEEVVSELGRVRPRYLIFERLNAVSPRGAEMARIVDRLPSDPRIRGLLDGYRLETTIEDFTLYRRVD
jgi:4-amino-4-deoxy-L-arabinose transferase-like glycosyltransferase